MTRRRASFAGALALGVLVGIVCAQLMPRGPVTAGQVVVGAVVGAGLGLLTGYLMATRWAAVLVPATFALGYELGRLDAVGPSVDRPRLDSALAVIVLLLGRGFSALVLLAPIVLGSVYGVAWSRRAGRGHPDPARRAWARGVRRATPALAATGIVALVVLLAQPGRTAAILDPRGEPVSGSIAQLVTVRLGGHDQHVLLRGRDVHKPVLLYLAGGPGQSDLGYTRAYMPTMQDDVVFAVWDQRGTGTSYAALDPTSSWTLDQAVSDTVQLSQWLARRFHQQRIYLFGNSWGSILGVLAVQRRPDLYAAYIGAGQMVDPVETDQQIYRDMQSLAERTHDESLARRLRASGPPPYADVYAYATQIQEYDRIAPYPKTAWFRTHAPAGIDGNGASEYGPLDKVNKLKALFDMGSVMYPQLRDVDLRRKVPALGVPVFLVQGAHELPARTDPARQWFEELKAPHKQWVTFAASGHVPQFEEFAAFRAFLAESVL